MKYIIDVPINRVKDGLLQVIIGVDNVVPRYMGTGIPVKPYTEPNRKAIEDAQEEAWEFAKQISIMNPEDKCELWGTSKYNTINLGYSYSEAKARYEEWKKQRNEFRVGDEVTAKTDIDKDMPKGIVTYNNPEQSQLLVIISDGSFSWWHKGGLVKTGRHFTEIEKLLEEMRE